MEIGDERVDEKQVEHEPWHAVWSASGTWPGQPERLDALRERIGATFGDRTFVGRSAAILCEELSIGDRSYWHRHSNVCIKGGGAGLDIPFPAEAEVTPAMCAGVGGTLMKITGWMVHAWVVPTWGARSASSRTTTRTSAAATAPTRPTSRASAPASRTGGRRSQSSPGSTGGGVSR